jgi:ATP-dependent Clp protease adaptor protein ClpS
MARPHRAGDGGEDTAVVTRTRTDKRLERPKLYKVLLHNDDYTTREFVVWILETIFHRSETEAVQIMLHVHNNGVGVAGVYPHDVADVKVRRVTELAEENEYPLLTTMEPEE